MVILNLNISRSSIISIYISLALIFTSCLTNRHKSHSFSSNNRIVYHVFDSLEQILCKSIEDIKRRHNGNCSSICVTISPSGNYLKPYSDQGIYKYSINVFYALPISRKPILDAADRYIQICDNAYPVYFYSLDDIFGLPDSMKNLKSDIPHLSDYSSDLYLEVNMSTKKVLHRSH